jgi:hypothetical protein
MTPAANMRLGIGFLMVSAGQAFVSRGITAALSEPLWSSLSSSGSKRGRQEYAFSFLSRGGGSIESRKSRFPPLESTASVEDQEITTATIPRTPTTPPIVTASGTKILADEPEFAKPDRDMHEYRYIQLANNLKVLLVSTAKASSGSADEKSSKVEAASVHVQAGHFDDTIPGLAHFHEHMLVRLVKKSRAGFVLSLLVYS